MLDLTKLMNSKFSADSRFKTEGFTLVIEGVTPFTENLVKNILFRLENLPFKEQISVYIKDNPHTDVSDIKINESDIQKGFGEILDLNSAYKAEHIVERLTEHFTIPLIALSSFDDSTQEIMYNASTNNYLFLRAVTGNIIEPQHTPASKLQELENAQRIEYGISKENESIISLTNVAGSFLSQNIFENVNTIITNSEFKTKEELYDSFADLNILLTKISNLVNSIVTENMQFSYIKETTKLDNLERTLEYTDVENTGFLSFIPKLESRANRVRVLSSEQMQEFIKTFETTVDKYVSEMYTKEVEDNENRLEIYNSAQMLIDTLYFVKAQVSRDKSDVVFIPNLTDYQKFLICVIELLTQEVDKIRDVNGVSSMYDRTRIQAIKKTLITEFI